MDLIYLPYIARIESHLAFIVLLLLAFYVYYIGSKFIKFIYRKVKAYVRVRKSSTNNFE